MQAGNTFSFHGQALVALCVQFLCSDWSKCDRWVHADNLCSILKLVYFDSWSWDTLCRLVMFLTVFSTGRTKWNTAAIKSLLLFIAGLFIGFFFEKCIAYESRKSDFGWHRFRFSPCLIRLLKRVQNSQAILALLDSFQGLHLEWWAWVIYKFHEVKRSLCGWFMHVFKIWDNDLTEYQVWFKITEIYKAFRYISHRK